LVVAECAVGMEPRMEPSGQRCQIESARFGSIHSDRPRMGRSCRVTPPRERRVALDARPD
jgi:hypothetical protein